MTTDNTLATQLDIHQVLQKLPHRYPFLLVDRVLELEAGKRIRALKNVSINEPHFIGHFPHRPVMPGVLIIEAMAQAAGLLAFASVSETAQRNSVILLVGVDDARFKRQVEPGDALVLEVEVERAMRGVHTFLAKALVGDALAASARLLCTQRNIED